VADLAERPACRAASETIAGLWRFDCRGTGCLNGLRCPRCGGVDRFLIAASSTFDVQATAPRSTTASSGQRQRSPLPACGWRGTVRQLAH